MVVLIVVLVVVAAGLAVKLRSESSDYDDRDRQGWWPGRVR